MIKIWHTNIDTVKNLTYNFFKIKKNIRREHMITWTKTLLSSYRYIDRVSKAIDKIVLTRAVNSFYTSGSNMTFNSVTNVSDDILKLTDRKINLINLKIILTNALKKTQHKFSSLLISTFVEGKTCFESVEALNISIRTFFRRQNQAIDSFIKVLAVEGYDSDFFCKMLKDENWILDIKHGYEKKPEQIGQVDSKIENKLKLVKPLSKKVGITLQTHNSQHF